MTHDRTLDCRAKRHGATHKGVAPRVDHEQIVVRQILPQLVGLKLFTLVKLYHAKNKTQRCTSISSPMKLHNKSTKCS